MSKNFIEKPCDKIVLKKPYLPDLEELHKIIMYRIDWYRHHGLDEMMCSTSSDITLKKIYKEISAEKNLFVELTQPIVEEFVKLKKMDECRDKNMLEIVKKKNPLKNQMGILLDKYLLIAQDYVIIELLPSNIKKKARCPGCDSSLDRADIDPGTDTLNCPQCGWEIQNFLSYANYREDGGSSAYEDRDNFIKKIDLKQGKIHSNFHPSLFAELDAGMIKRGYPTGEQVRARKTNRFGEKEGTDLEMLITVLQDIGCSKYYNDVDYLAHEYWGWTLLNFSHLESELIEMYDKTQRVYNEIDHHGRVAALNTELRLYFQLRALSFSVSQSRFRFQDSQDSLEFHHSKWRQICEKTKIPYHSVC